MPHLDTLCVKDIAVPGDFNPVLTNALSAGLSRLSSLRELILEGTGEFFAADVPDAADFCAASARLAAAVGNLTGLRHLGLNSLRSFLRPSDCRHHLRRLTQLSHLDVAHLVPTPGDATGGDGAEIVSMLSSMSQLRCLLLFSERCCAQTAHRVIAEAVPALPLLHTLVLPGGAEHSSCLLLAAKVRDGALPLLQTVGVVQTTDQLDELNVCANRTIFHEPCDVAVDLWLV